MHPFYVYDVCSKWVLTNLDICVLTTASCDIELFYYPPPRFLMLSCKQSPNLTHCPDNHWSVFCHRRVVFSYLKWTIALWNLLCSVLLLLLLYVFIFHSFYCWIVLHHLNIPKFVYPLTCLWIFGLFHIFGIVHKVTLNIRKLVCMCIYIFNFSSVVRINQWTAEW